MKKILTIALLALTSVSANASKAISLARQLTLADGRTVTATLVGDEHVNFFRSADGEIILRDADGTFHMATQAEKDSLQNLSDLALAKAASDFSRLTDATEGGGESLLPNLICPHLGTVKIPVILINFSDAVFTMTKSEVDEALNSTEVRPVSPYSTYATNYNYGSVGEYFRFCSSGKFNPQFDVYGPYTVSSSCTAYGQTGYSLLSDAANIADGDIDFSQYDSNNDGNVDMVFVFYAGFGSNYTGDQHIWPKCGYQSFGTKDGKRLMRYLLCNEVFGNEDIVSIYGGARYSMGVTCHEFSHGIGLPDLYPTNSSSYMSSVDKLDNQSMEDWDLMDNGENLRNGFAPTPYSAWERALMGWTDPIETISEADENYTIKPWKDGGKAYKIQNPEDSKEYWILENVPKTNISAADNTSGWYRAMPHSANGLVVTHVNFNQNKFNNSTLNNTIGSPGFTILPADGYLYTSYHASLDTSDPLYMSMTKVRAEEAGDPFPYVNGETKQDYLTEFKNYSGTMDTPVSKITRNDDGSITFRYKFLVGNAKYDGNIDQQDVNYIHNVIMKGDDDVPTDFYFKAADANSDSQITGADIVITVANALEE